MVLTELWNHSHENLNLHKEILFININTSSNWNNFRPAWDSFIKSLMWNSCKIYVKFKYGIVKPKKYIIHFWFCTAFMPLFIILSSHHHQLLLNVKLIKHVHLRSVTVMSRLGSTVTWEASEKRGGSWAVNNLYPNI